MQSMRGFGLVSMLVLIIAGCGGDDGGGGSGTPCTGPGDYPTGEVCEDQVCVPERPCAGPADCATDEICSVSGACIPTGTCLEDGDCADADFCSAAGTCIPDGTCAVTADCLAGMMCDAQHQCVPGGECGATEIAITPIPPNVLMVLDRSCSMRTAVAGTPKWTSAVTAVNQLTTNFAGDIRWGLTMFPDTAGDSCGQGAIPVPVAAATEPMIPALLTRSLVPPDVNYPDSP